MKVLSDRTEPPARIVRTHSPPHSPYAAYRACLRWEHAFTCAFCLTHEADFMEHGAEGTGLFWIEHRTPRSDPRSGAALTDEYANCFYACRFCNRARDRKPLTNARGQRLLDPCTDAWSDHFSRVGDELRASLGDVDAEYTRDAYDINEPRKRRLRVDREETLAAARRALREIPRRLEALALRLERPDQRIEILAEMKTLQNYLERSQRDLRRFALVPLDAPVSCLCDLPARCSLPQHASRWQRPSVPTD